MKKRVFITGATGNMGWAGFQELLHRKERFDITLLARKSKKNLKLLKPYLKDPSVRIVWGDLCNYEDVLEAVNGADYVLHVGGMVSPMADMYPEKTMKVNIGAARNVIKAVKAQPDPDKVKVVYIGSVAELGHHSAPYHWARSGDPVYTSVYDWYSVSKCEAELLFAESGLRYWVSIRQSGMVYPALLMKMDDPIAYHVPMAGVLEWATVEDSGRVLANVCEDWVDESFWRGFYNLSSGPSFRLTNYEFESLLLKTLHCPKVESIFDLQWFATRNFHGCWYTDSDVLENYLHFRENVPAPEYFKRLAKALPWYFSLAPLCPAFVMKAMMRHVTSSKELGTIYWLKHNNTRRINAHFGSLEQAKALKGWESYDYAHPSDRPILYDHGYDESKEVLDIEDMKKAAEWRGGKCLSENMTPGDLFTPLEWECHDGHRFRMSPNSILKGGHWCPDCMPKIQDIDGEAWHFEHIAAHNPFFAQVYNRGIE